MVFNSFTFIIFLPVVVAIYYALPVRIRYIWLLGASYFFYMSWEAIYGLLLLYSTAAAFAGGLVLSKYRGGRCQKAYLALFLSLVFAPLVFFKYTGFLCDNLNSLFLSMGAIAPFDPPEITLPIGISFFTFQAAGYVIDVYRGTVEKERNFLRFALFVSFFPQLVAGPIERTKNLLGQLDCNVSFDFERARDGLWLMLWGFAMKVVVADRIAIFVDRVYDDCYTYGGVYLIIASTLFAMQIYCDFAGYSTIAIGAAKIMGIKLMDNFASPYNSCSVSDFWRRWHISLTSWFKDYVYIPLGGNRKGKVREYINKLFVFALSGLWHGAEWSFVVWGALNGLWLVLEDALKPLFSRISAREGKRQSLSATSFVRKTLGGLLTFVLVDLAWIFFRAATIEDALYIIGSIFHTSNWSALFDGSITLCGLDAANLVLLAAMIALIFTVDALALSGIHIRQKLASLPLWMRSLVTAAAAAFILLFGIWGGTYAAEAFIYFQF